MDETLLDAAGLAVRERMFLARNFAYAWLAAALLQLGMLAVPAEGRHVEVVAAAAGIGLLASVAHFVLYERVPIGAYSVSLVAGWIAAGIDLWAAGDQAIVSVLYFAWIGVYAAAVFGLRLLAWQLPVATVSVTAGIAWNESGVSPWLGPFAIATIVTMCVLVYTGNVRTQRLFSTVVREREVRERAGHLRQVVAELSTAALAASSTDELTRVALRRLAEEGFAAHVEDVARRPVPGTNRFEIAGTESVLVAREARPSEADRAFLASVGRVLGLAEQRFSEEARRVRLERELADARRLEAIGRLAGGVAHDFNNVLTVIIGNTELAVAEVPEGSETEGQLREVILASRRAAALVAQLLALGSRQLVTTGPVDVGAVVVGLEDILRRLLGEGCPLEVLLDANVPPCRGETTQVEQVILNLVANARDAMPRGGRATLSVERVTDPPDAPTLHGDFVALTVRDTGVGMDDETRRRAFEPFFSSKPFGSGTGLGLATVHGILTQSGGAAAIESEPGQGTAFRVYLPVHVAEPVPANVPTPA